MTSSHSKAGSGIADVDNGEADVDSTPPSHGPAAAAGGSACTPLVVPSTAAVAEELNLRATPVAFYIAGYIDGMCQQLRVADNGDGNGDEWEQEDVLIEIKCRVGKLKASVRAPVACSVRFKALMSTCMEGSSPPSSDTPPLMTAVHVHVYVHVLLFSCGLLTFAAL